MKALLIVLDGLSVEVVERGLREGRLPTLERLGGVGATGILRSAVPPDTAAAMASLLTGSGPGRHGVFSLLIPEARNGLLRVRPAQYADIRVPTLFDYSARTRTSMAAFGIPLLSPVPEPPGGFAVPGFASAPGSKARPAWVDEWLEDAGFEDDVPRSFYGLDPHDQARILRERMRLTVDLFLQLVEGLKSPPRISILWLPETDRAGHTIWDHRELMLKVYEEADRVVSRLVDHYGLDETVIVVTGDHGFTSRLSEFFPNYLLLRHGLLKLRGKILPALKRITSLLAEWLVETSRAVWNLAIGKGFISERERERLAIRLASRLVLDYPDIDLSKSLAFSISDLAPYGMIYTPRDILNPPVGEDRLREEQDLLSRLKEIEGLERFVDELIPGSRVYGTSCPGAPAILFKTARGYSPVGRLSASVRGPSRASSGGMHDIISPIFIAGPGVPAGRLDRVVGIEDVFPTLLSLAGLPLWRGLQGRPVLGQAEGEVDLARVAASRAIRRRLRPRR